MEYAYEKSTYIMKSQLQHCYTGFKESEWACAISHDQVDDHVLHPKLRLQ